MGPYFRRDDDVEVLADRVRVYHALAGGKSCSATYLRISHFHRPIVVCCGAIGNMQEGLISWMRFPYFPRSWILPPIG
jgi:hypothetical protein